MAEINRTALVTALRLADSITVKDPRRFLPFLADVAAAEAALQARLSRARAALRAGDKTPALLLVRDLLLYSEPVTDTETTGVNVLLYGFSRRPPYWLANNAFYNAFVRFEPTEGCWSAAHIAWHDAIAALDSGYLDAPGSQQQTLRLAASLAVGTPVNLRECLRPGGFTPEALIDVLMCSPVPKGGAA